MKKRRKKEIEKKIEKEKIEIMKSDQKNHELGTVWNLYGTNKDRLEIWK